MTFLPSKIPLIQAPMAGAQGPELTIAVCRAGGLGSLPAAMLTPDRLREQIAAVRQATDAPFNVNFFSHGEPKSDPEIEARWRKRLAPFYAEAGLDPAAIPAAPVRAPFDEAMCAVIEETRPSVVSFHFGLPPASLLSRVKAAGALILASATTVAEARWLEHTWSRRRHRSGARSGRPSRHVPHRRRRCATRTDRTPAAGARRGAAAGRGGRRDQRRARNRGGLRARRRRGPDRHGLSAHSRGDDFAVASRRARQRAETTRRG